MNLGDQVEWSSQSAGTRRTKRGVVVEIVEPGARPKSKLNNPGLPRDHESYVVRAIAIGTKTQSKHNYWPRVSVLALVALPSPEPKSFCTCEHTGDGANGEHAGILGHGACLVQGCGCAKFTWSRYLKPRSVG